MSRLDSFLVGVAIGLALIAAIVVAPAGVPRLVADTELTWGGSR